jgi:uncharacterized protein
MVNQAARDLIATLQLSPLPHEGGFFRQTWSTPAGTAIYFLMTSGDFSALHRLRTDEVWHFYAGDGVEHVVLDPATGRVETTRLGPGRPPALPGACQLVARGGVWQGARLAPGGDQGWALLGCTMAPPWTEEGFELGDRAALLREFPAATDGILALTRVPAE